MSQNIIAFVASQIYLNLTPNMDLNANLNRKKKEKKNSSQRTSCVSVDTTEG